MLHGGNFQAKSITSAMEKVRQACQAIGRLLSVQCTELINPTTSRGLPPNLVVDEPSESFLWKGTDIMVAALQSELGFLANPAGSHVQTAEMGNQAINSLALTSARYTLDALEVLNQLSAAHLLALCQALDLRAMNLRFTEALSRQFKDVLQDTFAHVIQEEGKLDTLAVDLWKELAKRLNETSSIDSSRRFQALAWSLQPSILQSCPKLVETLETLAIWTDRFSSTAAALFDSNREQYTLDPDATPYLGTASAQIYGFVRRKLGVSFLREAIISTPKPEGTDVRSGRMDSFEVASTPNMGRFITMIYESMRSGGLFATIADCLRQV